MKNQSIASVIAFITLVALFIIGAVLLINTRPAPVEIIINPPPPTATASPTRTPAPIMVYVTGAVNNPETTVILQAGSRVEDAINEAGGFAEFADRTRLNLAAVLRDGDQVHVFLSPDAPVPTSDVAIATPTQRLVHINSATLEELMTLPTIGEVTAGRIIAYREENGDFASLEDLGNVQGIGTATLARLEPLITFDP